MASIWGKNKQGNPFLLSMFFVAVSRKGVVGATFEAIWLILEPLWGHLKVRESVGK